MLMMCELKASGDTVLRPILEAIMASAGMGIFGLFVHSCFPWTFLSGVALLITALAITHSFRAERCPSQILGLLPFSRKVMAYLVVGGTIGTTFGVLFRIFRESGPFPAGLGWFVFVAAAVGACEEVLFRGYIQGRFQHLGGIAAPILAAAAHTTYKVTLFAVPLVDIAIDYQFLATWTFIGGVIFGGLRQLSGSVLPSLAGHVLFDIIVYGGRAHAPWWVWL
jgi:membrane protease YdiL (CAAX protease family)